MKNKRLKLIALVFVFFFVSSIISVKESPMKTLTIIPVEQHEPATEVWSYDFDDGNISEWGIFGIGGYPPYDVYPGNFSAVDGALRSTGVQFSIAALNRSVAYGTWTFDVDVVDTSIHEIVIPFISIEWDFSVWMKQTYWLQIVTGQYEANPQTRFRAGKSFLSDSPWGRTAVELASQDYDDIFGWKHIIITRDHTGQFYVYVNETLVLGYKDTQHTTCNQFIFSTRAGPAIDNIVVSDTVDYDAAPPEWDPEPPTNQAIVVGQDFRYDLNATDFSEIGSWSLNDTANFGIDSNGVITNTVNLALGTYGLNVSVSDTGGFTRSAVFNVIVERLAQPDLTPYVLVGGGVIVVIVLVVVFLKKRN